MGRSPAHPEDSPYRNSRGTGASRLQTAGILFSCVSCFPVYGFSVGGDNPEKSCKSCQKWLFWAENGLKWGKNGKKWLKTGKSEEICRRARGDRIEGKTAVAKGQGEI